MDQRKYKVGEKVSTPIPIEPYPERYVAPTQSIENNGYVNPTYVMGRNLDMRRPYTDGRGVRPILQPNSNPLAYPSPMRKKIFEQQQNSNVDNNLQPMYNLPPLNFPKTGNENIPSLSVEGVGIDKEQQPLETRNEFSRKNLRNTKMQYNTVRELNEKMQYAANLNIDPNQIYGHHHSMAQSLTNTARRTNRNLDALNSKTNSNITSTTPPYLLPSNPETRTVQNEFVVNDAFIAYLKKKFPISLGHKKELTALNLVFPKLDNDYYLYDKIGEGTFSSVYKGIDVKNSLYDNESWDHYPNETDSEAEDNGNMPPPPPPLLIVNEDGTTKDPGTLLLNTDSNPKKSYERNSKGSGKAKKFRYRFVAIKKIYVTSSCPRIENEIEILNTLSGHPNVVGLITVLRKDDQVIVVTPYYRHHDFRETFTMFTIDDMVTYMRCLLRGIQHCHLHQIIHRDVKPSNFLFHITRQRGQLADFGLAQKQEPQPLPRIVPLPTKRFRSGSVTGHSPLPNPQQPNSSYSTHPNHPPNSNQTPADPLATPNPNQIPYSYVNKKGIPGILRDDNRPSIKANRAGTRGFRAPEVLLKVVYQTTAIDIWSAGVILLCLLSKRFPFFNSPTDQDALIELGIIFGKRKMQELAASLGRTFLTDVDSLTEEGVTFEELLAFVNPEDFKTIPYQAIDLLERLLELDPEKRITADQALSHPFLA